MKKCIEACQQCLVDCKICLTKMAGQESMNDCPLCCVQCIDAVNASLNFMLAESKWSKEYCELCAEICEYCADQCEKHDHEHCKKCAESCRACADACRKMAA
ncbi:MAG: hypothetical protein ACJA1A_002634 [Saprospiraceae bacterium]|jgi:hypothetical protein